MLSLKHTLLSPCTPASGKPESQLEPGRGDFPAHFQGPLNLPDLVVPFGKEAGPSSLFWGRAGQLRLSVCLSVCPGQRWGPRVGEEVSHLTFPRAGGAPAGVGAGSRGDPVCVAERSPAPPLSPPQTLLMESSWPRGGRAGGGGRRVGGGVSREQRQLALPIAPPGGSSPACVRTDG